MESSLFQPFAALLAGVTGGVVTYCLTKLFFDPILKYNRVKYKIDKNLIYYANALFLSSDESLDAKVFKRCEEQRLLACELRAAFNQLNIYFVRWHLDRRGESPLEAAGLLIQSSNTLKPYISRETPDFQNMILGKLKIPGITI